MHVYNIIMLLGFTPCKAEQPLQDMKLQEKDNEKKHVEVLFKNNRS